MSVWGRNGDRTDEALDDATVEDLLAGRYEGEAPDLVALSELLGELRSLSDRPPPLPSESLARILGGDSAPAPGAGVAATSRRLLPDLQAGPFRRALDRPSAPVPPRRSRKTYPWIVTAAVSVVLAVVVVTAGSARLLPGPTQDVVAKFVQALTPFDFPEKREAKPAGPKAPSPEMAPPTGSPPPQAGPAGSSEPRTGDSGSEVTPSVGRDGSGSHSEPSGVGAAPAPATTVPGRNGPSSPSVPTSVPAPAPERHAFTAELAGATASQSAGDPDGHATVGLDVGSGGDELCLTLAVSGVAPMTAVHLHAEAAGVSRRVLVAWTRPTPGGSAECVTVDGQLLKKLGKQPAKYFVDVHTTEFPNGALRGPLAG